MNPAASRRTLRFRVVGIGASAGGLEATREFLEEMPLDTGMAFIVLHHLAEKTPSYLPEILARSTRLPVVAAADQVRVEPNRVYVMPATADLEIKGGRLVLVPRTTTGAHLPIDHFFKNLAENQGDLAVGIVLSGTGADGSKGLREIKDHGGLAFVQDVQSAKYHDMPRQARAAATVDYVGSPREISREIVRFARGEKSDEVARFPPPSSGPGTASPATPAEPETYPAFSAHDEAERLGEIFLLLREKSGVDFSRYKRPTLLRRIGRRMQLNRVDALDEYIALLRDRPDEVELLFGDLLITVTEFFRDPETFDYLKNDILPELISERAGKRGLRIWVAGVATGEEAYSLGMALLEVIGDRPRLRPQIFATDVSEQNLQKARMGVYPGDIATAVSADRLRRFFEPCDGGYQVTKELRQVCIFARHNLISDPPFSRLDMVSCRNLMIYFDPVLQERVAKIFHYALGPGGLLLLGRSESLPRHAASFKLVDRAHHVYTRMGDSSGLPFLEPSPGSKLTAARHEPLSGPPLDSFDPRREAERVMAAAYAPVSVLINDQLEVLSFQGRTGSYLEHAEGRASFDLLRMAKEGLGPELRRALEKAKAASASVEAKNVRIKQGDRTLAVDLEIRPFRASDQRKYYIVVFRDVDERHQGKTQPNQPEPPDDTEADRLREELEFARAQMEAAIEEKETGLEEIKATNEEIQSSNEELQSANEELETAKEELESINEELTAVNDQLDLRNRELSDAHDFIANLLANVEIPIVMVDSDLRVRRYAGAEALFDFRGQDIGRPITDLVLKIDVPDLEALLREVINFLVPIRREVADRKGRWYSLTIRPYRSVNDRIEGAVLALVDVDDLRRKTKELQDSEARFRALTEAGSDALYHVSPDWKEMRQLHSRGFLADTERPNRNWLEDYVPAEDRPRVAAAIDEAIRSRSVFEVEHRVRRRDGGLGWASSRAVPVFGDDNRIVEWFGAATDITESKRRFEEMRAGKVLEDALNDINVAIASATRDKDILPHVLAGAALALEADLGLLLLRSDSGWVVSRVEGEGSGLEGERFDGKRATELSDALAGGRPIFLEDLDTAPGPALGVGERFGMQSMLIVPLIVKDDVTGAFALSRKQRWPLAAPPVEFANKLAGSVSAWLSNRGVCTPSD